MNNKTSIPSVLKTSANPCENRWLRISGFLILVLLLIVSGNLHAQPFVHPGIDMNQKDLDYMKKQVLDGKEPWKGAFERLKEKTKTDIKIVPVTHVIQGGYGVPDIGGFALMNNSNTVYDCALIWYITGEEKYARKAIEIIDKWDVRLWSFDENNAKLVGGLSCYPLCSGAEILRYHYSGWT